MEHLAAVRFATECLQEQSLVTRQLLDELADSPGIRITARLCDHTRDLYTVVEVRSDDSLGCEPREAVG